MSDTPETDAVAERLDFKVDLDFARKLERERDEAREEIIIWKNRWKCAINDIVSLSAPDPYGAHERMAG